MKSFDEKTEPATPKRRQEARSKGNVAKSEDLNTAMLMLFGTVLIYFLGGAMVWDIQDTMSLLFRNPFYENFNVNTLHSLLVEISSKHSKTVLPIMGGFMVIGIISSYSQVGFNFAPKALMPDFKKLDPIKGLKGLVSKRALVRLATAIVKLSIMAVVAYLSIRKDIEPLLELVSMGIEGIFSSASSLIFGLVLKITIILLILALFDLMYQRWQYKKDLMMSKYEVKQESKQREADPLIKSKIKSMQREMSKKRMMEAIPEADVVVSNPTHYAIALKYDVTKMNAPKVVAKGLDFIALKIIEIAREHNIPVVEDRILARILHNTLEIDSEIPPKLYQAVAKVLSYVYQLRNVVGK